jgi:hypothetical protein
LGGSEERSEEGVYEVAWIKDHTISGTNQAKRKYLVVWKGFPDSDEHNEWLSLSSLNHAVFFIFPAARCCILIGVPFVKKGVMSRLRAKPYRNLYIYGTIL